MSRTHARCTHVEASAPDKNQDFVRAYDGHQYPNGSSRTGRAIGSSGQTELRATDAEPERGEGDLEADTATDAAAFQVGELEMNSLIDARPPSFDGGIERAVVAASLGREIRRKTERHAAGEIERFDDR